MSEQEYIGHAMTLVELTDYQRGSVVSKQLIKKNTGSLTVFAFDEGEGLTEHTSPYDATILVLEGKAQIMIGGNPHEVSSGEMLIMPAKVPHAVKAIERFKMLLIMIKS
jgi:quercetin dioxygenase-like cupin family protein